MPILIVGSRCPAKQPLLTSNYEHNPYPEVRYIFLSKNEGKGSPQLKRQDPLTASQYSSNPCIQKLAMHSNGPEYTSNPNIQSCTSESSLAASNKYPVTQDCTSATIKDSECSKCDQLPTREIIYAEHGESDTSYATLPSVDYNLNDSSNNEMYEKRFSKLCNSEDGVVYRGASRERINQLNRNRRGVLFKEVDDLLLDECGGLYRRYLL